MMLARACSRTLLSGATGVYCSTSSLLSQPCYNIVNKKYNVLPQLLLSCSYATAKIVKEVRSVCTLIL